MEAAVQMQMAQQVQASGGYVRTQAGKGTGMMEVGADGAQMGTSFEVLLVGMLGTAEQEMQAEMEMLQQLQNEMDENGSEAAMQMMAELFFAQPAAFSQMDPTLLATLTGTSIAQVQTVLQQVDLAGMLPQDAEITQAAQQAFEKALAQSSDASFQVVKTPTGTSQSVAENLMEQAEFQRAVYQVRQMQDTGTAKDGLSELEALMNGQSRPRKAAQAVDPVAAFSQQVTQAGQAQKATGLPQLDPQQILDQVKTGLQEGIQQGKNDFIIKLKPEGLGEITVRMTEEAGKLSIQIQASNQNTHRLLSGELSGLRQAMEPYNAVVNTAQPSADSTSFGLEQQMRQGFAQQQGNQQQDGFYSTQEDGAEQTDFQGYDTPSLSELDTYI